MKFYINIRQIVKIINFQELFKVREFKIKEVPNIQLAECHTVLRIT